MCDVRERRSRRRKARGALLFVQLARGENNPVAVCVCEPLRARPGPGRPRAIRAAPCAVHRPAETAQRGAYFESGAFGSVPSALCLATNFSNCPLTHCCRFTGSRIPCLFALAQTWLTSSRGNCLAISTICRTSGFASGRCTMPSALCFAISALYCSTNHSARCSGDRLAFPSASFSIGAVSASGSWAPSRMTSDASLSVAAGLRRLFLNTRRR